MTLRLPPELDAQLRGLADARHMSKHALVLLAVETLVGANSANDRIMASVERTLDRDAELLSRLEDA